VKLEGEASAGIESLSLWNFDFLALKDSKTTAWEIKTVEKKLKGI